MALEVIYLEDQALFFMSKLRLEKTVQKLFQPQIQVLKPNLEEIFFIENWIISKKGHTA